MLKFNLVVIEKNLLCGKWPRPRRDLDIGFRDQIQDVDQFLQDMLQLTRQERGEARSVDIPRPRRS